MTETGRKWVDEQMIDAPVFSGFSSPEDVAQAAFWIRAFCEEVRKRAKALNADHVLSQAIGCEFQKVERELLGD